MNSLQARVHRVFGVAVILFLFGLLSWPLQVQAAPKVVTGEIINVIVDEDACLSGYSFCMELGTTNLEAQAGNDAAVLLVMQLIKPNGQPLTGLVFTDFFVDQEITPSGAGVILPDSIACPTCFFDHGDGVYRLVMQPQFGNWRAGSYILQLRVVFVGATVHKLFSVDVIP